MKYFLLYIAFLFLNSNCYCQTINGKVSDTDTQKSLAGTKVFLTETTTTTDTLNICYWEVYCYKIIQQTITDSSGRYSFSSLKNGEYNIIVNYDMPPLKELNGGYETRDGIDSNIYICRNSVYLDTFNLMVTCPYDKTKNQAFCPICKKNDEVLPILFGLPNFDSNGNIAGYPDGKYYLGGCIVDWYCNPTKHCNRCNKDF